MAWAHSIAGLKPSDSFWLPLVVKLGDQPVAVVFGGLNAVLGCLL